MNYGNEENYFSLIFHSFCIQIPSTSQCNVFNDFTLFFYKRNFSVISFEILKVFSMTKFLKFTYEAMNFHHCVMRFS